MSKKYTKGKHIFKVRKKYIAPVDLTLFQSLQSAYILAPSQLNFLTLGIRKFGPEKLTNYILS